MCSISTRIYVRMHPSSLNGTVSVESLLNGRTYILNPIPSPSFHLPSVASNIVFAMSSFSSLHCVLISHPSSIGLCGLLLFINRVEDVGSCVAALLLWELLVDRATNIATGFRTDNESSRQDVGAVLLEELLIWYSLRQNPLRFIHHDLYRKGRDVRLHGYAHISY